MSQAYYYPSPSLTLSAIGTNGAPIPTTSILIAGKNPSGNLKELQTDASGYLYITAIALPLPAGAATAAKQDAQTALLTTIDASNSAINAKLGSLGQKAMAGSAPVVIASDQSAIPVSAASLPLPSGAATSANQSIELARLSGSLVPTAYDEVDLTYVPSGAGVGQVATAVYKLASSTVKTLTMSYDGSDRLSSVVAS